MIGLGFLIKSVPNLIAGYNTMSKEQKKNVDIEGLSTFMRNGLIIIGLAVIVLYYLFKWMGFPVIANLIMPVAITVGVIIMVILAQKFDHNKKKKTKQTYITLGLIFIIFLFVIGWATRGLIPSKVTYNNDMIQFSGEYGFEISIEEIDSVELASTLPTIKIRTNGLSLGPVNKGFFNLDEFGKSRLLMHSYSPPYLIMTKNNGEKIIINFRDQIETEKTYNKIKSLTNK